MKIENTKDIQTKEKKHIAVIGGSKTGKTRLIQTLKGKTLIGNSDKGLLTLKGSTNIDFTRLDTFEDVIEFMKFVKSDKNNYDNIAIDSISVCADLLLKYLEQKGVEGYTLWKEYAKYIGGIITTLRDSNKYNSISIFELVEKENESGIMKKGFGVQGNIASRVPYFYDYVFATRKKVSKEGIAYKLQTQDKDGYECGYRGDVKLEAFIEPDLDALIKQLGG